MTYPIPVRLEDLLRMRIEPDFLGKYQEAVAAQVRAGFWKRIGTKDGAEGAANSSPTTPTMNDVTTMPGATGVTGGVGKGRAGVGSGRAGVGAGRGASRGVGEEVAAGKTKIWIDAKVQILICTYRESGGASRFNSGEKWTYGTRDHRETGFTVTANNREIMLMCSCSVVFPLNKELTSAPR